MSMNVTQTMEAVNRSVPTHKDHECVAAGLGLCQTEMVAEVSHTYLKIMKYNSPVLNI